MNDFKKDMTEILIRNGVEAYEIVQLPMGFQLKTFPEPTAKLTDELSKILPAPFKLELGALPANWHPNENTKWTPTKSADVVNHPSHYNSGKIEVIEFIEDQRLNYHLGNTVKYICRAGKKDPTKEIEDLEKAQWYLLRRIEELKALKEGRAPVRPNEMKK